MSDNLEPADIKSKNKRLVVKLGVAIVLMFGFGFALVPLYDVFCEITGINGRLVNNNREQATLVDKSRVVRLQFTTSVAPGMPWQFKPHVNYIDVHPGESKVVKFLASNQSGELITGQAIPSVSPGVASLYLNKTECFCFQQQILKSGESVDMGLVFFVSTEIPQDIKTLTLSYTLFNVTDPDSVKATDLQAAL
ncbi:cytochrome c oxidase assembly protein [Psychrobium sp. MM17-31]|uniref:cytochrome c oxidase assembly protein n=1 Tax=Psychrobium sp. MM17-31 TaxID=2917758 RepID=UPI001EF5B58A|nr:cytochrome c oxidase assembly protein [Psychrobium sp. MM17-31]MCG7530628.1 cytochrome c oxidase assembly protein [Psychrobium sp. MM17-31]